jgi:RNA polymerase sigma-70 factor (sigma-E family)
VDVASDPDALDGEVGPSAEALIPAAPEFGIGDPTAERVMAVPVVVVDDGARVRRDQLHQLYEAHYADLVRLACLLLDRTEAAEEVVQDAFVKLYSAIDRIEDRDATPAYLRSMVMNGARSKLRRRRVARKHPPKAEPPAEGADAAAVVHEDQREVIEALRTLPTRQRECLVLRYYGGCSEAEIAEILGIARGTVKSSVSRAMATMAERLASQR